MFRRTEGEGRKCRAGRVGSAHGTRHTSQTAANCSLMDASIRHPPCANTAKTTTIQGRRRTDHGDERGEQRDAPEASRRAAGTCPQARRCTRARSAQRICRCAKQSKAVRPRRCCGVSGSPCAARQCKATQRSAEERSLVGRAAGREERRFTRCVQLRCDAMRSPKQRLRAAMCRHETG